MRIAEQISRLRTRMGMSQGELAEVLEVSRQSVSKWETGASMPEIDKLVKMSALFGVSLDELVTGSAPEQKTAEGKNLPLGRLLGAVLLVLAGICLAVTVLFESTFGFHLSEGVLLAVWFALLGLIALDPGNEKLRVNCFAVWSVSALAFLLLALFRIYGLQGTWIFLLIGGTLAVWTVRAGKK